MSNVIDLAYWRQYDDVYHTNEDGTWYDQERGVFMSDLVYRKPKVIDSGNSKNEKHNNDEEKYSEDGYAEQENNYAYHYHKVTKNDYSVFSFGNSNYKINTIKIFWRY